MTQLQKDLLLNAVDELRQLAQEGAERDELLAMLDNVIESLDED